MWKKEEIDGPMKYSCNAEDCDSRQQKDLVDLLIHKATKHPDTKMKCDLCKEEVTLEKMRNHSMGHVKEWLTIGSLICSKCYAHLDKEKPWYTPKQFVHHISENHGKKLHYLSSPTISAMIEKKFYQGKNLEEHEKLYDILTLPCLLWLKHEALVAKKAKSLLAESVLE